MALLRAWFLTFGLASARGPTEEDCMRLRRVADFYRAKAIARFQWRKRKSSVFLELDRSKLQWKKTTNVALFGDR